MVENRVVLVNEFAVDLGSSLSKLTALENKIKRAHDMQARGIELSSQQKKELAKLEKTYTDMGGSVDKLTATHSNLLKSFTQMRWALVNVAMAAGVLYGAYRLLIEPSIQFEQELTHIRTATGMSIEDMNALGKEMIDLSTILPISAQELAKVAVVASKFGLSGQELVGFTSTVAQMSLVTGISAEEVSKDLGKISNAFGMPISNANNLASVILRLDMLSIASSQDIVNSLTRVAAAGNNLGLSIPFVAALETTLIDAGIGAERAGTRMQSAFNSITGNIPQFVDLINKVEGTNLTVAEFSKQLNEDASGAIMRIIGDLDRYGSKTEKSAMITKLFGSVGGMAIQTLVNQYDLLAPRIDEANKSFKEGADLIIKSGIEAQTTAAGFTRLGNELKAATLHNTGFIASMVEAIGTAIKYRNSVADIGGIKMPTAAISQSFFSIPFLGPIVGGFVGQSSEMKKLTSDLETLRTDLGKTSEEWNTMVNDINSQKLPSQMIAQMEKWKKQWEADKTSPAKKETIKDTTLYESATMAYKAYADQMDLVAIAEENLRSGKEKDVGVYEQLISDLNQITEAIKTSGFDTSAFQQYYSLLHKISTVTEEAAIKTDKYASIIDDLREKLDNAGDIISDTKDEISALNDAVSNILNRRFNIRGVSQTDVSHLIRQQELELAKAKFATLGLGTAEDFLRGASLQTADSINGQTEAVQRLTAASKSGQSQYDVWKTALSETIRALLINSQSLDKDVTSVVKKAQTELMGFGEYGGSNNDQFSAMTNNLDALNQAQDIFFGSEQEKLDYSEKQREDRINGMNTSAEAAINELQANRDAIDLLLAKEDEWIAKQKELQAELEATIKLQKEQNQAMADMSTPTKTKGDYGTSGNPAEIDYSNLNPEMKSLKSISESNPNITAGEAMRLARGDYSASSNLAIIDQATAEAKKIKPTFNDFIARPGVPATAFSPSDTIIGVKDTSSLGKGSKNNNININIQGYNQNPRELALEIQRQLAALA